MTRREKEPAPIVIKTQRGLSPVASFDAEVIYSDQIGQEYDLVKRSKRSNPQLRLYWSMLGRVVQATGKWPSSEHLSDEIKLTLGYVKQVVDLRTGEVTKSVDSIALNAMSSDQFRLYFDQSVELLSDHLGIDPLAFMRE